MSNINSTLLGDLSESQKSLNRSQALLAIAESMSREFVVNETTHNAAYHALRHILIASHHLTANAIADLGCSASLIKSFKDLS
jgi:hypothetical protein